MITTSRGFTVIEIIIVITILAFGTVLFFTQKNSIEVAARDDQRKTAINGLYYSLEEVYFMKNKSYPRTLTPEILPSVDPAHFIDPQGVNINDGQSDYRYEGRDCTNDSCKEYALTASLEAEADYRKTNR